MDLSRNLWFFLEISLHNNHSNINRLLVNASLSKEIVTANQTHFIIKSIFWVIHFMVITNWGYTQNFEGVIELIRNCGGNELKTPFLSSPKNMFYITCLHKQIHWCNWRLSYASIASIVARKASHFYNRWNNQYYFYWISGLVCHIWA